MSLIKPVAQQLRAPLEAKQQFHNLKRINGVLQTLNVGNEAIYTHQGQVLELLRTHNLSPMSLGFEHRDTPSLEGLAALIRKGLQSLVSSKKPGVLIDTEGKRRFSEVLAQVGEAVRTKYTNDTWLKKQTLVDGEISGQGIASKLSIGGKFQDNFSTGIKQTLSQQTALERQYARGVNAYVKDLDAIHREVKKHCQDGETLDAYLKGTALKQLAALKTPTERVNMVGKTFRFFDNVLVTFGKDLVDHKREQASAPAKIRPLTLAEIPQVAELVLDLLTQYNTYKWPFSSPPLDHEDSADPVVRLYDDATYADDYYDYMEWSPYEQQWTEAMIWLHFDYLEIAAALEQWIDRSIK